MRTSHTVSLLAVAASVISAQQIVPTSGTSTFPACAVGCPALTKAQTVCTPPNAIVATQEMYDTCFCLIPSLADLYTTGETLCTDQCTSTADRQQLSTWFVDFCRQAGQTYGTTSTSTAAAAATTLSTSTISTASDEPTRSATTYNLASSDDGPWVKTHWPWIIMLVVLFVGLLGIGFGARWWKKRHDKKIEQGRAGMLGFPPSKEDAMDKEIASPDSQNKHNRISMAKAHQSTPSGNLFPINSEQRDLGNAGKQNSKRNSKVAVTEIDPVPPPVHTRSS